MRRSVVALLAVAVLCLSTTAWAGQGRNKNRDTQPQPPVPAVLMGTLVKTSENEITVTLKLPVNAATTSVMIDNVGKTLADLKPGQSVAITITNGKPTRVDATQPVRTRQGAAEGRDEGTCEGSSQRRSERAAQRACRYEVGSVFPSR